MIEVVRTARGRAMPEQPRRAFVAVGLTLVAVLGGAAAAEASETAWVSGPRSATRLILGGGADGAAPSVRAGLELRLDDGWKTYWRYPGDAGIPPRFAFARSTNVRSVDVAWPAPQRFESAGTVSIGYGGGVVFPLIVHPVDPGRPISLVLDLSYAVCGDVCIPADVALRLPIPAQIRTATLVAGLSGGSGVADARLRSFEARVPRRVAIGEGGSPAIERVAIDRTVTPWRVAVDAAAPPSAELFVEGPNSDWALPVPAAARVVGDRRVRFTFDLDGAPAGFDPAAAHLTLTLVAGLRAIEAVLPLD